MHQAVGEWKKEYASKRYQEGKLTLEGAAMEASVSVRKMMEYLRQKGVASQYRVEDPEEDMRTFYTRMGEG